MKYLKTIIPTIVLTIIFCYICMTPSVEPQIKSFTKDGDKYYIVTLGDDRYLTKLDKGYVRRNQEWVNMDTKRMLPRVVLPFVMDSKELYDIVIKLWEEDRLENLIKVSEGE